MYIHICIYIYVYIYIRLCIYILYILYYIYHSCWDRNPSQIFVTCRDDSTLGTGRIVHEPSRGRHHGENFTMGLKIGPDFMVPRKLMSDQWIFVAPKSMDKQTWNFSEKGFGSCSLSIRNGIFLTCMFIFGHIGVLRSGFEVLHP